MSEDDEFERNATATAGQLASMPVEVRYAAAARGSANPAALAWLAEALGLGPDRRVVDLGAGMGGPSGWIAARYGCRIVAVEPSRSAAAAAGELFDLPVLRATSAAVPLRSDAFDAALLLGVLSVVDDGGATLGEARRVAGRLGVLEWCATGETEQHAGGSRFPTPVQLEAWVAGAGWTVEQRCDALPDAPRVWDDAADEVATPPDPAEDAVVGAIERGELRLVTVVARR